MNQTEILRILKNGAEKPIDKLNDFTHGKSSGEMQAYSHAYTLVKNLSIHIFSQHRELLKSFSDWLQGVVWDCKHDDYSDYVEDYIKTL